jgi:hypothetical protein
MRHQGTYWRTNCRRNSSRRLSSSSRTPESKLSRREIIELRAGRSTKLHRKTQELLVSILKKLKLI